MRLELDYTVEDIAEVITILRVQKFKLSTEAFADKIGVNHKTILQIEDARGAHVINVFQRLIKMGLIKNVGLTLEIAD